MKRIKKYLANDHWIDLSKLWHILICAGITFFFGQYTALGAGVLKEISDIGGSGFSYKDLFADAVGILIGNMAKVIV